MHLRNGPNCLNCGKDFDDVSALTSHVCASSSHVSGKPRPPTDPENEEGQDTVIIEGDQAVFNSLGMGKHFILTWMKI